MVHLVGVMTMTETHAQTMPDYLSRLNPPQRAAVEALEGPVLVLAGAGTGKTSVLTTRLAHLLLTRPVSPWQVLAVTFTNKAAGEMRDRVARLTGAKTEGWWMGTFHALAARILRRHASLLGLQDNFTILDADDQLRLVKQLMEAANLDTQATPPKMALALIQKWKDRGEEPDRVSGASAHDDTKRILRIYADYQARLKTLNACDFGDLLLHNLTLFRQHPDILKEWQNRFRYILVDEYQDTNLAQYLWLRLLAQGHANICCVGDDDQSIYGWRGAEVGNILRFEKDFPGAKVVRLEQNYRSTGHILATASGLIAKNSERLGKTLWTQADMGDKVAVRGLWDSEEESRWVGEEIETAQRRNVPNDEIAILVRAGFQTREFEERLGTLGVPFRVIGGARFYERQEIRDALAYLRLLHQPADDLAFERIINTPKRGLGDSTLQLLREAARSMQVPLFEAVQRLTDSASAHALRPKVKAALSTLVADFNRWRNALQSMPHPQVASLLLDESGYNDMWRKDKSPEAPGRLENLRELITAMADYESLAQFLEHVALVMEQSSGSVDESVTIMTLHAAKGLEFDLVFLPGWEEGIFPSQRALEDHGDKALQEERRLAYVGITRARKTAKISYAARRRMRGMWEDCIPSRFIGELPKEHVEQEQSRGMFATGGYGGGDFRNATRYSSSPSFPPQSSARRTQHTFRKGATVSHARFGTGLVCAIEEDKISVMFDDGQIKQIMASFLTAVDDTP